MQSSHVRNLKMTKFLTNWPIENEMHGQLENKTKGSCVSGINCQAKISYRQGSIFQFPSKSLIRLFVLFVMLYC